MCLFLVHYNSHLGDTVLQPTCDTMVIVPKTITNHIAMYFTGYQPQRAEGSTPTRRNYGVVCPNIPSITSITHGGLHNMNSSRQWAEGASITNRRHHDLPETITFDITCYTKSTTVQVAAGNSLNTASSTFSNTIAWKSRPKTTATRQSRQQVQQVALVPPQKPSHNSASKYNKASQHGHKQTEARNNKVDTRLKETGKADNVQQSHDARQQHKIERGAAAATTDAPSHFSRCDILVYAP